MPTILLIRHGDNDVMKTGLAGRLPEVHLNESGRQQAYVLAGRLASAPIKAIYSSPLERAVETARPLAEARSLEVIVRPGLIELDYGEWQGQPFKRLQRTKLWKLLMQDPAQVRFPGGETLVEAQERARLELEAIAGGHEDKHLIACVTHGDLVRLLVAYYLDMQLKAYHRLSAGTASLTVLSLNKERQAHILTLNQVAEMRIS